MTSCNCCGNETSNPKFCSRSCAAKVNNKITPKRRPHGSCKLCGKVLIAGRTYCKDCFKATKLLDLDSLTYGEITERRGSQKHSQIREYARKAYSKSNKPKKCLRCGYDKHFEVCHIKAIKLSIKSTRISEINSLDNLIALCPNCHWEFDAGLWQLSDIGVPG